MDSVYPSSIAFCVQVDSVLVEVIDGSSIAVCEELPRIDKRALAASTAKTKGRSVRGENCSSVLWVSRANARPHKGHVFWECFDNAPEVRFNSISNVVRADAKEYGPRACKRSVLSDRVSQLRRRLISDAIVDGDRCNCVDWHPLRIAVTKEYGRAGRNERVHASVERPHLFNVGLTLGNEAERCVSPRDRIGLSKGKRESSVETKQVSGDGDLLHGAEDT